MSLSLRGFFFVILLCGFVVPVYAVSFEEHVNSYCEVVRRPRMKPHAGFTSEINRMAEVQQVHVKREMVNRYPDLVYLLLLTGASWKRQEVIDNLQNIGAKKRIKLCRVLEMERLKVMLIDIEYDRMESYCAFASRPHPQPNAKQVQEIAELAKEKKFSLPPDVASRYPTLARQLLLAESSEYCGNTQELLDNLEGLGMEKRENLCRILEDGRLKLKRIDLNYESGVAIIEANMRK